MNNECDKCWGIAMHLKLLKCSFDINVSLKWEVVMTKCLHTISRCHARHHWARASATAMAVNRGGSAALPTHFPLNCPNIYSFYSGLSNKQGCGFVSEAKARIGGSVSPDRGQASSGAGRMLAVWQRSADTATGPRTVKHEAWSGISQWSTGNMDREVFKTLLTTYNVFTFTFVWGWLCQLKYVHSDSEQRIYLIPRWQ